MRWGRTREPEAPVEWLIVGLGNPGPEYRGTRHNVGFEVVDRLESRWRAKGGKGRHRALLAFATFDGKRVLLAKPLTFMNRSGESVGPLAREHQLTSDRVLVIADDMDLRLGQIRLREKGSSGGHNGHKSVAAALGTTDYPRFKVGIGRPESDAIDHVLLRFDQDERGTVDQALQATVDAIEALLSSGIQRAQEALGPHNRSVDE